MQAHASVERAFHIGAVKCHFIESDADGCMRGDALQKAIDEDKKKGLLPFCVSLLTSYKTLRDDLIAAFRNLCVNKA